MLLASIVSSRLLELVFILSGGLLSGIQAQANSVFPVPIALRSPYMNIWHTDVTQPLGNTWPCFWRGALFESSIGWTGKIKVDGRVYSWLGHDGVTTNSTNTTSIQVTPTRTIFNMQADAMSITVTFLSPIEPSDWVKQSLPFTYYYLEAQSLDGNPHTVQLYSDTTAEWLSGDRTKNLTATNTNTGTSVYHEVELLDPQPYQEITDHSEDGKLYFAMASQPGLSWQIGDVVDTRFQFQDQDTLTNSAASSFAGNEPLTNFAFAMMVDLGEIQSTSSPIVWAVGYVRDPSINYTTPSGTVQQRRSYFFTQYSTMRDAIDTFIEDFDAARERAIALDNKLDQDASQVSPEYAQLVALAARQTMGLDITAGIDRDGNPDPSDVKIFMKDIGDTSPRRTNPVEQIYAALPAYIYLNASFVGALLKPLVESQDAQNGQTQPYSVRDMGSQYPTAQIEPGAHSQGIEESGNMLIMLYAHARISGDGSLLVEHYNMYTRWADWLISNSLMPTSQVSADAESIGNLTNLALKGILGVKAMAEISRAIGNDTDAQHYDEQAAALIGSWQSLATSSDGQTVLGIYGNQQSWSLLYNLYPDKLLGTNIVPNAVVEAQTRSIGSKMTGVTYGIGIDSTSTLSQTSSAAWNLFAAATMSDDDIRNQIIRQVWTRTSRNATQGAFPNLYNNITGETLSGTASPALGAMFSILALSVPNTTIITSGPQTTTPGADPQPNANDTDTSNGTPTGAIAGGIVGGLAIIGLAVGTLVYFKRRTATQKHHLQKEDFDEPHVSVSPFTDQASPTPLHSQSAIIGEQYAIYPWAANNTSEAALTPLSYSTLAQVQSSTSLQSPASRGELGDGSSKRLQAAQDRDNAASNRPLDSGRTVPLAENGLQAAVPASQPFATAGAAGSLSTGESVVSTEESSIRREMDDLRRQVQEMRAERAALGLDLPPPEYPGSATGP